MVVRGALAGLGRLQEHLVAEDLERVTVAVEQRREAPLDLGLVRQGAEQGAALGDLVQLEVLHLRRRLVVEQVVLLEALDRRLQRRDLPRVEQPFDDEIALPRGTEQRQCAARKSGAEQFRRAQRPRGRPHSLR